MMAIDTLEQQASEPLPAGLVDEVAPRTRLKLDP
jgi:hypothetical protein